MRGGQQQHASGRQPGLEGATTYTYMYAAFNSLPTRHLHTARRQTWSKLCFPWFLGGHTKKTNKISALTQDLRPHGKKHRPIYCTYFVFLGNELNQKYPPNLQEAKKKKVTAESSPKLTERCVVREHYTRDLIPSPSPSSPAQRQLHVLL